MANVENCHHSTRLLAQVIIVIIIMVIIIASKNLHGHDIHPSDVIAKHPWYEELARDSQRPREHRIGNAGHY